MDSFNQNKRTRPGAAFNDFAGAKRFQRELESIPTATGSRLKPCTKFFSTSGCPFGEGCHFQHYVPGGVSAVAQMTNSNIPSRNTAAPPAISDGSYQPATKTRLCNKYNTAEGCKFGAKCHFAHGEWELNKPTIPLAEERPTGWFERQNDPPHLGAAASFGASATAKISVDASLAGSIIGKGGMNSKRICHLTGCKLSVREHESDPNQRNVELEGTFDQIKHASAMVRELIVEIGGASVTGPPKNSSGGMPTARVKTKLCENFTQGSCSFGDRCHFAHGSSELRAPAV